MSTTPPLLSRSPLIWLLLGMAVATIVYWQGLAGPYLMDDAPGLLVVKHWSEGSATLLDVLLNNSGWHTHRALAYASLALNAAIGGFSAYSFKAGNLFFHLACSGLAFLLLRRLLRRDRQLDGRAGAIACIVTVVWLLHPLNVSTVLYPIQRMAQIAMLMTLAGLLFYSSIRARMLDGRLPASRGMLALWLGIPAFTFLAIQGKQSAIVLPAMCLVIEMTWFQRPRAWPPVMSVFYSVAVALPALAALIVPFVLHEQLAAAFTHYDFSAAEKVLSAPRILLEYMRMLVVPYSPAMGIFNDNFPASRSLWDPVTTTPAILALLIFSGLAWVLRRVAPAVLAGWALFLIGHSVEASYTPIELYYEHRNYATSIWFFLSVISLLSVSLGWLERRGMTVGRVQALLLGGVLVAVTSQTLGRALLWQNSYTLTAAAVQGNPESLRAVLAFASASADLGRFDDGFEALERLGDSDDPVKATQAALGTISLQCRAFQTADPAEFDAALATLGDRIELNTFYLFHVINQQRRQYGCGPLTAEVLAEGVRATADRAVSHPDTTEFKTSLRYLSAVFFMDADRPNEAAEQAILAWQPGVDPGVGRLLVDALIGADRLSDAQRYLREVAQRTGVDLGAPTKSRRDVWGLWDMQQAITQRLSEVPGKDQTEATP